MHLENLEIRKRVTGEESVYVAETLGGLGIIYANTERFGEAIAVYSEALEILRGNFGDNHPDVATNLSNLGSTYKNAGDWQNNARVLRELIVLDTKAVGPTHRWVMADYKDLIWALARFDPKQAELAARERLTITAENLEADDPIHLESQALLGMTLGEQQRFDEAEQLLVRAFQELTDSVGSQDGRTDDSLDYLVRLFELMERPDAAEKYRAIRDRQVSE
jgi:tetratricopeptide (TPR) repeat protein